MFVDHLSIPWNGSFHSNLRLPEAEPQFWRLETHMSSVFYLVKWRIVLRRTPVCRKHRS